MLNFKEIASVTLILFSIIDIVGSIPIIVDLRQKVGHIQSEKASLVALFIMIGFLFLGESIDVYSDRHCSSNKSVKTQIL